jgi:ketosteroid isomerase-like protein
MSNEVADRLAINELIATYNDAVMRFDADAWGSTWAEDGVWSLPGMGDGIAGRDTIVATWKMAMDQFEFVGFFASPGPVQIDGDTARGTLYQQELLVQKEGGERQVIGRYSDEFAKVDGKWFFKKRVYEVLRDSS